MATIRKFSAVLLFVFSFSADASEEKYDIISWKRFVSSSNFSVDYPSDWKKLNIKSSNLDIINSSRTIEGVVIPRGASAISVYPAQIISESTYLEHFHISNPEDQIIGSFEFTNPGSNISSCKLVQTVQSKTEIGPNTYQLENHMYCHVGAKAVILSLRAWASDGFKTSAVAVAIKMIRSLSIH